MSRNLAYNDVRKIDEIATSDSTDEIYNETPMEYAKRILGEETANNLLARLLKDEENNSN
jgi:hypothetical protein